MSAAQRLIRTPSELDGLNVLMPRRRIRLDMDDLSEETRRNWEKRLNRAQRASGNGEMAIGFLIGLVLAAIAYTQAMADRELGTTGVIVSLSALLTPTLAGKLIGLASAQSRLHRVVTDFRAQWPDADDAQA